jgi:hypothetical protein
VGGSLLLLRRRRAIPIVASSITLLALIALIGLFPQSWYQASYMALPAHRYYIFYSLVALTWLGLTAILIEKRFPPGLSVGAIFVALAQLSFSGFFALRMIEARPHLQSALEASRWVVERSSPEEGVALALTRLDSRVTVARGVLAPRRIDVLEWRDESTLIEARRSGARYLITDVDLAATEGFSETARFDLKPETARVLAIEP